MRKGFFVTGTDTGVGKTYFSVALVHALRQQGKKVAVMKPVASGGSYDSGELRNEDAQHLLDASGLDIPYELVNPYVFEAPVAPHIAAGENNVEISIPYIVDACKQLAEHSDTVVVEGVGGWQVPLNMGTNKAQQITIAHLAKQLGLPVILVVGMQLGCINHALLTVQSIQQSKAKLYGWVANSLQEEMLRYNENIETLKTLITAPLLAEIPHRISQQEMTQIIYKQI